MSKRFKVLASTLMTVLALGAFPSQASSIKGSGTLETVVKEVAKRQKTMTSLQADFRQEKEMALLAKPEVSTGTFLFSKPNNVLWNYAAPKPVTILITGGKLTTYYPQLNKAETLEVTRYQDRIFKYMGASGAIDELMKYFNFKFVDRQGDRFYRLELTPNNAVVARRVKSITIWIDRESYLTSKFEYVEKDGDVTRYEFTNIRMNAPIPQEKFTLKLPAGTKVEQLKLN